MSWYRVEFMLGYGQLEADLMAHSPDAISLKTGLAAGVLAGTGQRGLRAARGTATDWGNAREVRRERCAARVRHRNDERANPARNSGRTSSPGWCGMPTTGGIRFFETAESYGEMHKMLGVGAQRHPARFLPADVGW